MKPDSLPAELSELENRLRQSPRDDWSIDFRDHMMRSVSTELAKSKQSPDSDAWDSWRWLAIAASIIVVLNVSLITASRNEFSFGPTSHPDSFASELRALRLVEIQTTGKNK